MNTYQYVSLATKLSYLKRRGFKSAPVKNKTLLFMNYIHVDVLELHEMNMEQIKRIVWLAVKKFKYNPKENAFENEFFAVKKADVMNVFNDVIDTYKKHIKIIKQQISCH